MNYITTFLLGNIFSRLTNNALEQFSVGVVNTLRPIQYTQKSCSIFTQNDNVRPSFIAHELQEQFPDIVSGTKDEVDDDGLPVIQQFDSPGLTAYLVKAVQELTNKLVTTFMVAPLPFSPMWTTLEVIESSIGYTRSKASLTPPTIIEIWREATRG